MAVFLAEKGLPPVNIIETASNEHRFCLLSAYCPSNATNVASGEELTCSSGNPNDSTGEEV